MTQHSGTNQGDFIPEIGDEVIVGFEEVMPSGLM